MKALHIPAFHTTLSTLSLSTVPDPVPSPSQLLIRITHASPQAVDVLYALGKHQNNNAKRGHIHPPFILGNDFAGVVVSAPPGSSYVAGENVFGSKLGAFAELIAVEEGEVGWVPGRLRNADAVALVGGAVAYAAVKNVALVREGQTVLVTGAAGGLGTVACQVAQALGARVIGLVGSEAKATWLREHGGVEDVVIMDQKKVSGKDWERWVVDVLAATTGDGVDAIIDNIGCVEQGLRCLKSRGTIVMIGFAGRDGVMETIAMNKILLKSARVIGYRFGDHGRRNPDEIAKIWEEYLSMVNKGTIRSMIHPAAYHGLEDVPRALHNLQDRKICGKAVIQIASRAGSVKL
ncbi:hypothetical protein LTR66_004959 [Elasticomyces elasticus]|nr:hypothetical protein LTR50_002756 [Elasticomyces elasticus]KAK4995177.1 hypothetical protein LTR66_004959 [Elasticomyces elasticus]